MSIAVAMAVMIVVGSIVVAEAMISQSELNSRLDKFDVRVVREAANGGRPYGNRPNGYDPWAWENQQLGQGSHSSEHYIKPNKRGNN